MLYFSFNNNLTFYSLDVVLFLPRGFEHGTEYSYFSDIPLKIKCQYCDSTIVTTFENFNKKIIDKVVPPQLTSTA